MKTSRLIILALGMLAIGSATCFRQQVYEGDDVMRPQFPVQCHACGTEVVFVDYSETVATCKRCGKPMTVLVEDGFSPPTKPTTLD